MVASTIVPLPLIAIVCREKERGHYIRRCAIACYRFGRSDNRQLSFPYPTQEFLPQVPMRYGCLRETLLD